MKKYKADLKKRQSVNEEYDSLLKKERPKPEGIKTEVKVRLPRDIKPDKPKVQITYEDIARIKDPWSRDEKSIKTLDEIEKEDKKYQNKRYTIVEQAQHKKLNKERMRAFCNSFVKIEKAKETDNLIEKVITDPTKYIKFKFIGKVVYRQSMVEGLEGYDCVIGMDGTTLWDRKRAKLKTDYKEIKRMEGFLALSRKGDSVNKELIEGKEVRKNGTWLNLDYQIKDEIKSQKHKSRILKTVKAEETLSDVSIKLGLSTSSLKNLVKVNTNKKELGTKTKSGLIRQFKYDNKVYTLTAEDRDVIRFIGQFKWSISSILMNLNGTTYRGITGQMSKLEKMGIVRQVVYPGLGDMMWLPTKMGQDLAGFGYRVYNIPAPGNVAASLGVQHVASYLYNNRVNVLNLKEFPYKGKLQIDKFVQGETLVSEQEIKASLWQEQQKVIEESGYYKAPYNGFYFEQVGNKKKELMLEWKSLIKQGYKADSPEFIKGYEFAWTIFPSQAVVGKVFHNPDLVVKRERLSDGSPQSIAIEVERKNNEPEDYAATFRAYANDPNTYKQVIWITPLSRNANKIREGARLAKFKDYKVLPMINEQGHVNVNNFWDIAKLQE